MHEGVSAGAGANPRLRPRIFPLGNNDGRWQKQRVLIRRRLHKRLCAQAMIPNLDTLGTLANDVLKSVPGEIACGAVSTGLYGLAACCRASILIISPPVYFHSGYRTNAILSNPKRAAYAVVRILESWIAAHQRELTTNAASCR